MSVEAVDPVFQAKMLDMLKQTGRWDNNNIYQLKILSISLRSNWKKESLNKYISQRMTKCGLHFVQAAQKQDNINKTIASFVLEQKNYSKTVR